MSITRRSVGCSDDGGANQLLRCHLCGDRVSVEKAKHLPMQTVGSDQIVFERAKERHKKSHQIFPTFETVHVSNSSDVQHRWAAEQFELQNNLLRSGRRGSVALQKHDHPFCSWECVKGWAHENILPHLKYHTDILIDVAAGYAVNPTVIETPEK